MPLLSPSNRNWVGGSLKHQHTEQTVFGPAMIFGRRMLHDSEPQRPDLSLELEQKSRLLDLGALHENGLAMKGTVTKAPHQSKA